MCGTMGYLFHVWGGVGVCYVWYHGLFVSCLGWCSDKYFLVISICTELFLF